MIPHLLLLPLVGCDAGLPAPEVTSVRPAWGYYREPTPVEVEGRYFYPEVELDPGDGSGRFDRQFKVELVQGAASRELEGIEFVDYGTITATVPAGLGVGLYDVLLTSPGGSTARLADGFEVTSTRADHLVLLIDEVAWEVYQEVRVGIELRDPEDMVVSYDFPVTIDIEAPEAPDVLEVWSDDLLDVEEERTNLGVRLSGRLSDLGSGTVSLYSPDPTNIRLGLDPGDSDSPVEGDELRLSIDAGEVSGAVLTLPTPDFRAVAGQEFPVEIQLVDDYGNPRDDSDALLTIVEGCGPTIGSVSFIGSTTVTVAVTTATNSIDCAENAIQVVGTTSGSSDAFEVDPAEVDAYQVDVSPGRVVAGTGELRVAVRARDVYGNVDRTYGEDVSLTLRDDLGGLDAAAGIGSQECPGFFEGYQICTARLWRAGEAVRVTVSGSDGIQGESNPLVVTPGPLSDLTVEVSGTVIAGEAFDVRVLPQDAWTNVITTDPSVDPYTFDGKEGEITCTWNAAAVYDAWRTFSCTTCTGADPEVLTVSVDSAGGHAARETDPFVVHNGQMASVSLAGLSAGAQIPAGRAFPLTVDAFDACGNPYTYQPWGAGLDLLDRSGTLSPTAILVDALGHAAFNASATRAQEDNQITVTSAGLTVGVSPLFDVIPGALDTLDATLDQPWTWVGTPRRLDVRAVDAWGNVLPDFDTPVTVASSLGTTDDIVLDTFVEGVASVDLEFVAPGVDDTLLLACPDLPAYVTVRPLDVLQPDCGVEAVLLVDGLEEEVLCRPPGGTVTSSLDTTGSTGTGLTFYFLADGEVLARTTATYFLTEWTEDGARTLQAVAFDPSACGAMDEALVWVAQDDGQPAGPVTLTSTNPEIRVGSPTAGATTILVTAQDCTGDVASAGTLFVRSDLGDWASGLSPTGAGLAMTLDPLGAGSASLTVEYGVYGGTATVRAGRLDGAAVGSVTVEAKGDNAPPHVLAIQPQGSSTVPITDTVSVWFDEEMSETSLEFPASAVTLLDADGVPIPFDQSWDAADLRIDLLLHDPIDPSSNAYFVGVSTQARDLSGNRLDGAWTGTYSSFTTWMGDVATGAVTLLGCTADTTVLRSDGDDVPGTEEADRLLVTAAADGTPAWWRMTVATEAGEAMLTRWTPATSATEDIEWDGRGVDGKVVANGLYVVTIDTLDPNLNATSACVVEVLMDNLLVDVD